MSDLHRHSPELFEEPSGVCHHSEPFCERCCPNKEHRELFNTLVALIETPGASGDV